MKTKKICFILTLVLCVGFVTPTGATATNAVQPMDASIWTSIDANFYMTNPASAIIHENGDLWIYLMYFTKHEIQASEKVLTGVKAIASSILLDYPNRNYTVLALKNDGTLWFCYGGWGLSWGDSPSNTDKQRTETYFGSFQIDSNVVSISSSYYLKANGNMYYLSKPSTYFEPGIEKELIATDVIDIAGGSYLTSDHILHVGTQTASGFRSISKYDTSEAGVTFAIADNGDLYSWGNSRYGEGGGGVSAIRGMLMGAAVMRNSFVLQNVMELYFNDNCIYARDTRGQLWQWGDAPTAVSWGSRTELDPIINENERVYWSPRKSTLSEPKYSKVQGLEIDESGALWYNHDDGTYTFGLIQLPVNLSGVLGSSGARTSITPTSEAPSSWAAESVSAAIAAGLVPDTLQSKYTTATTRAEFCALAVALYETVTGAEITERAMFSDSSDINVQKMAGLGVVNGIGDGKFGPGNKLTREQAATMLSRLADAIGKPLTAGTPTFNDNASVSSWAFDAVGQMQATGVMGGVGDNTFSPATDYTREQSIITIMRLFDIVK